MRVRKRTRVPPQRHHLDRRAAQIVAASVASNDDPDRLMTTRATAAWIGVSKSWLDKGRIDDYGPPFFKEGSIVRYRRGTVRDYLEFTNDLQHKGVPR